MEAHDPIAIVIAALNSFEPSRDDIDNLHRLYRLFEGFRSLPDRERVAPAMFNLLERFPDAEFGSPGPLVHELEAIPGYLPLLRGSVRPADTPHRLDDQPSAQYQSAERPKRRNALVDQAVVERRRRSVSGLLYPPIVAAVSAVSKTPALCQFLT
jgi:hypothetical protein